MGNVSKSTTGRTFLHTSYKKISARNSKSSYTICPFLFFFFNF